VIAHGTVVEFDEARGLGTVESGGRSYPFHCTQIADGTRTIEVGTSVEFEVAPGVGGTWEARGLAKGG
jgi:CspA family cold shock protein